jgi:DNA-binding XRE family transcriptional regulator
MTQITRIWGIILFAAIGIAGAPDPVSAQVDSRCTTPGENVGRIRETLAALEQSKKNPSLNYSYNVTQTLNMLVQSNEDIQDFRCQDTLATIQSILSFARLGERSIRINSSLLLANVVDNTTLCAVLNDLSDPSLDDNTRYNLWQVVRVVAQYARPENKVWIIQTVQRNEILLSEKTGYEKTRSLMDDVKRVVAANKVSRTLKDDYGAQRTECLALPNIADLPLPADLQ